MRRGTNLPAVGGYNRSVVLDAVRRESAGLSRTEIAERTGLSPQAVTNVSRRLLDAGLIRESGTVISGPGKPRTMLQLEPGGSFALGVHVDPAVVTYVLLDLHGTVVAHAQTPTPSASRPDEVVGLIARTVDGLVADSGVDRARLLGIGIAAPGPIDVEDGVVLDPPMLPRWRHVPLRRAIAEATGLPVLLEKDVAAAAVAELWFSDGASRRDFAFVYYGTGFGTGLVIGRDVVRGSSSNAGDSGHVTVASSGRRCTCGRIGCVGELITPHALVRQAVEAGVLTADDLRVDVLDAARSEGDPDDLHRIEEALVALAGKAADGDEGALEILHEAARHLARAVVVVLNLLDLAEVVFGGPFWHVVAPWVLQVLPESVRSSAALIAKHPIALEQSAIGTDVAAVGAACLVLDHAFSPRPSALLISA
ncbi:ROK family transcriptional regulator [uncultured Frigoribacterium sp.]|uniref:ROK family transcriptional regulator n=1 Tax=uncultured Frigoribacterium sp. TaxID=335377 RepID=UPI0028D5BFFF|nr:ROK family transcriptional regulator [uncultured Frigoribacterium sp.]